MRSRWTGEIQAVYYLTGDYDALLQMEEGEFAQAAEDAVLLWEEGVTRE